jgi:tRNA (guanine9-N1)-methyltransferase
MSQIFDKNIYSIDQETTSCTVDSDADGNNKYRTETTTSSKTKSPEVALESPSSSDDINVDVSASITTTTTTTTTTDTISKNQLKKRRRFEKAMEIKQRKKQQNKQVKLERAKAQGRDIEAERKRQDEAREAGDSEHRVKRRREWEQIVIPKIEQSFQICIDCAFESLMTAKEINSLAIQLRYCYSNNKRSQHSCQLTATSIGNNIDNGTTSPNIESNMITLNHLKKVNGVDEWSNWAFVVTSESLEKYFSNNIDKVVYLTSDSETTLHVLENDKIYVIGGIVDRNRLKRIAIDRANTIGVKTAKLPIDEHLSQMPSTRVLTTNHVCELLLKYKEHNGCWKKALADVLPIRKEAKFVEDC